MKHKLLFLLFLITTQLFSQIKNQSIGFKENKGQIVDQNGKQNNTVKYLLNSNGLNVQLKRNGFSYDIYEVKKTPIASSSTAKTLPYQIPEKEEKEQFNLEYEFHRVDIDFVNSNPKVELITKQKSSDFDNYYNVPNKPEGVLEVHQYKQITYKNIYPNIDVVFTIPEDPQKTVEYNFIIHPKGKISDIQLKFSGAETNLVDNKIQMNVRFGKIEEKLPASWIEEKGHKKGIVVGYQKLKKNVYGFRSANFLIGKKVVIDPLPVRLWGTFYGGDYFSHFTDIDSDSQGNSYITGNINGPASNYASTGAHQTTYNNSSAFGTDGIIAKFDNNGQRVWGTYYGGVENDKINGLVIDKQDNVIISGESYSSTNIATAGSFKPTKSPHPNTTGENADAFLVKFNSAGLRLWGTYFGGIEDDSAYDVDIDSNNNIYIVGKTNSSSEISFNNNFQTALNKEVTTIPDRPDAFIAKFNSNGNIIWGTYAGGEDDDSFTSIKVSENYLVVAGNTRSLNHISTSGVFQENKYVTNIPSTEGTIYKFTLNGGRLWSTYFSGELGAEIKSIEVDDENNVYIAGHTYSHNNIATPGSFDDDNPEWWDTGFIVKFGNNGKRIWGTYVGLFSDIHFLKFKNNHLYVSGRGGNDTSITTPCAYRRNASNEGYLGKFSKNCELIFGTYIGGFDRVNEFNKICFDNNNNIIVGGDAEQNNGIADSNSYQPVISGQSNFYLIKFKETTATGLPDLESNSPVCIGKTLQLKASGGTNYSWTGPNGFTSTNQNPTITNATTTNSGEYRCLITGTGDCDDTKKINVIVGETPLPTGEANQSFCTGQNPTIASLQITGNTIKWYDAVTNGNLLAETTNLIDGKTYYASQTINSCEGARFGVTVSVVNTPSVPTGNPEQAFCKKENRTLNDIQITGQNIKWFDSNFSAAVLPNTTLLEDNKTYYASQTIGCESDRVPILVHVYDTQLPTGNSNQQFCIDQLATLENLNITGTALKWYDSASNGNLLSETDLLESRTYYATQTLNNCESERFAITVKIQDTQIPIANSPQQFCIQKNAKISDIAIIGQNLKWYESVSSSITLSESTPVENGISYYVSQTISNCESDRIPVTINILEATTGDCINFVDELPFPKFFTPNGDGFNDTWTIESAYLAPNSSIRIFDRYGKFIKELPLNTAWNGTYLGNQQPASDYWFTVTRINGIEFRGHFSLKR